MQSLELKPPLEQLRSPEMSLEESWPELELPLQLLQLLPPELELELK